MESPFFGEDFFCLSLCTLVSMDLLKMLGEKHKDWCAMVGSFGCPYDLVEDIVQEMYLRMYKYVDNPERIMYNETEVNTYFVYVTLRNMYLDYVRIKKRINVVHSDDFDVNRYDTDPNEAEELLQDLTKQIWKEVESWHWYDEKMFSIYMNTDMSMRTLSKETRISLRSIFNTIKNGKERIKDSLNSQYEDYKEAQNPEGSW
jgi:DNA-directed RNA polymerase specialized sigma24 family protein